jgi:hypothetical protein
VTGLPKADFAAMIFAALVLVSILFVALGGLGWLARALCGPSG